MLKCSEKSSWFSLILIFNLLECFIFILHDKTVSASSTVLSPNIKYLDTLDSLIKTIPSDRIQK